MAAASLRCSVPGLTRCPPHQRPRRTPSRIRRCRQSSQVRPDICTKVENRTSSRSTPNLLKPKLQVYSTFPLDHSRVRKASDKSKIYTIDILEALTAFYGPRDLTQDRRASTPLTARPSHNGGHHHARPQRRVPTSRMLSSIFLKMLRGGFAPSGYRPSNDQPTASRALHAHLDMLLTTADLI